MRAQSLSLSLSLGSLILLAGGCPDSSPPPPPPTKKAAPAKKTEDPLVAVTKMDPASEQAAKACAEARFKLKSLPVRQASPVQARIAGTCAVVDVWSTLHAIEKTTDDKREGLCSQAKQRIDALPEDERAKPSAKWQTACGNADAKAPDGKPDPKTDAKAADAKAGDAKAGDAKAPDAKGG